MRRTVLSVVLAFVGACGGSAPHYLPPLQDDAAVATGDGPAAQVDAPVTPPTDGPAPVGDAALTDAWGSDAPPGCLRTCTTEGVNCGPIGDGCGGLIQTCGSCTAPATCGGGGVPSVCGGQNGCLASTCADHFANCGVIGDGCGNLIECGNCAGADFCGGDGTRFKCGSSPQGCVPRGCADVGATCGPIGDGCGGLVSSCGTCTAPDVCGGGGVPSVCGHVVADGGIPCVGLCTQQVTCDSGTTSLSGTVYAPNGREPLANALVYVPNGTVTAFTPGVACTRCDQQVSGTPLVATTTAPDGTFVLGNMPVGASIPVVIQVGRWRRQLVIPTVAACVDTPLVADLTRLPKNQGEGDIPLTALVTGDVDQLECVLRKIGVDATEFTLPSGPGRVHLYYQNGARILGADTLPAASTLWGDQTVLDRYDQVMFACEGHPYAKDPAAQARLLAYADQGGRVFATHYSYTWLYNLQPWGCGSGCSTPGQTTAAWHTDQASGSTLTATVDTSFAKGRTLAEWLDVVGASTSPGSDQIYINVWRHDLDGVVAPATRWIYGMNPSTGLPTLIQHYTFNTPVAAAPEAQCGRVTFSDFHVDNAAGQNGGVVFDGCAIVPLTAQEQVLEYTIFDLASCISPDQGTLSICTPRTCAAAEANCGPAADGCGGYVLCGTCTAPAVCGGGGTPSKCGGSGCVPLDCAGLGLSCGAAGDGCGNVIDCGACVAPETCGGAGTPGVCGQPTYVCAPRTCQTAGANCGPIADGCGGHISCGTCPAPSTCGGGGTPSVCGRPQQDGGTH